MVAGSGTGPGAGAPSGAGPAAPVERLRFTSWSIVRAMLLFALGCLGLYLLTRASTPVWWLTTAAVVAAVLQPGAMVLRRWMPGWLAITTLVVVLMAVGGFLAYRGLGEIGDQMLTMRENALRTAQEIESSDQLGQVSREFELYDKVEAFFAGLPPVLGGGDTASSVQTAASSASALFAIGMLMLLLLVFGRRFARAAVDQIDDPGVRARVAALLAAAYGRAGRYAWTMAGRAVAIGVLVYVVCLAVGFPAPTALAAWFAAWSLVPSLGLVVAAFPLTVAFGVGAPPVGIVLFGASVVVQLADAVLVQSWIDERTVHIGPALTLVAALVGGSLYGAGGVLIGMAVTVFAMAGLRELGDDIDDVPAHLRVLARPAGPVDAAAS